MEPIVPQKKIAPGVYQGTPEVVGSKNVIASRIIRTMKIDVEEAIKNQNETAVSIAIAEEKKKAVERAQKAVITQTQAGKTPLAPKPIGRIVIVVGILLIGVALWLSYVFILPKFGRVKLPDISVPSFTFNKQGTAPTVTEKPTAVPLAPSLITAQSEKHLSLSGKPWEEVVADVATEITQGLSSRSIKNLYFTEDEVASASLPASRIFAITGVSIPEILSRSLEKEFMAGLFGEESWGATPFLILKVSAHETGLAGMLEWEKNLLGSFDTIFGTKNASGVATTTKFHDIVVGGKDARTLNTTTVNTLTYAFANKNTIIITGSVTALEALLPLAGKI